MFELSNLIPVYMFINEREIYIRKLNRDYAKFPLKFHLLIVVYYIE